MSINGWPGGVILKTRITPTGRFVDSAASGVWSLSDATSYTGQGLWPSSANPSPRGLFAGGVGQTTAISYITISTTGNATSFGTLTEARGYLAACSSSTRGVWAGGDIGGNVRTATIDYVTIATTGSATSFGSLYQSNLNISGLSNSTRGVFCGGNNTTALMQYITIATTGGSTNFGNLVRAYGSFTGTTASTTRGLICSGPGEAAENVIDYITIATTGNATSFAELTLNRWKVSACSSSTRAVFVGGESSGTGGLHGPYQNVMDYVTIASAGNAADFGDLTLQVKLTASCSSPTRGVVGYGLTESARQVTMVYFTIATTGNATSFGDFPQPGREGRAACSSAHGGI